MPGEPGVAPDQRWLSAIWPRVRDSLPPAPATVVEVGCGRHGGFIPALADAGYHAVGIDPAAPDGERYRRAAYECTTVAEPADAIIACTSLHHVADPALAAEKIAADLAPGGIVVVVEYDWERFDGATARWCFERLDGTESDGWLARHRARWQESGGSWESYFRGWAAEHGLQSAQTILEELERRFETIHRGRGPYFFSELVNTTEADELRAIEASQIHAVRVDYVGRMPSSN